MPIASAARTANGAPAGSTAIATSSTAATLALADQYRGLAAAIDELTEPGTADGKRHRVDPGDDAGGRERAGQMLRVDQQADAEHRLRQPRDDRDGEQSPHAGG